MVKINRHCGQKKRDDSTDECRSEWQSVVGLEVHAQITSSSKLFSGASAQFGGPANQSVALFDAAVPGTLPVLNRRCVEAGILTALALSCRVNPVSGFDRKHYFYADLPAGYQITQQRAPLASGGQLQFPVHVPGARGRRYDKTCRVHQLQLEQDSGKSLHDEEAGRTLVDLNRAGVPLMELVFRPDLADGEEAAALVRELMVVLQRLGTCSCRMDEGALRVDANVSVRRPGDPLGVRTEIKNIGSVRAVAHAVQFEAERQAAVLEAGGSVTNETRVWDAASGQTLPLRDKEVLQDYRFMPEPNLPPLRVELERVVSPDPEHVLSVPALRARLPELPADTRRRLRELHGLPAETAAILVNEDVLLKHFLTISEEKSERNPTITANLLIMDFLTALNKNNISLNESAATSAALGEVVDLLQAGSVNLATVRKILEEVVVGSPLTPSQMVERRGWAQIASADGVEAVCRRALEENPAMVAQYRGGRTQVFKALMGRVAALSQGRANMAVAARTLERLLRE
ncbi:glutamyl-tRNA(Gln) amidotransferase subunit B, mitochondrial isoform X2 [Bacillus rossius redtenbacheri]|uniref:glutamyl-tRNA(Gln) amidotransferase subunit B, mitochondrial isoform X2 n=1 Tax=Bacillus rossius redtenbacheri TaxID=93214 RepID=UPI002FDE9E92